MGLKYYLNLLKKESDIKLIKSRYWINIALSILYMICAITCFSLMPSNAMASGLLGMIAMLILLLSYVLEYRFQKLIKDIIKNEPLDKNDSVDAAFISYRNGFLNSQVNKLYNKLFLIIRIIMSIIFIAGFQLSLVLNISNNIDAANNINRVLSISMLFFLAAICVLSFIDGAKNGVWYQEYTNQLDIIKQYKLSQAGLCQQKQKYKLLEDTTPLKQLGYLFPDEEHLIRYKKLQKTGKIIGVSMGIIWGLLIVFPSILLNFLSESVIDLYEKIGAIILLSSFCSIIVFSIVFAYKGAKLRKKQYNKLIENESGNHLFIQLHHLRKAHNKKWNLLLGLGILGIIIGNIALAGITSWIANTDDYGWIFTLLIIGEIITLFVLNFKAFGRLRLKMRKIEKEIDNSQSTNFQ